jgi:hypothetical protein
MVGGKIGGVNVFGGGLPLFATGEKMVGPVGVSGDTSCAYHMIAWRVRNALKLDHMAGQSAGGFGHPKCINTGDQTQLPVVQQ